jgi:hypothetical protein
MGRHRLHGRKPARRASLELGKNSTFSGRGLRAVHDGWQKIPVVATPVKNTPSYRESLDMNAVTISSRDGSSVVIMA